jgi:hypothetical protein
MRLKILILFVSLLCSMLVISGGYGYWQKDLTIKGNITVVKPEEQNQIQQNALPGSIGISEGSTEATAGENVIKAGSNEATVGGTK